ncbi:ATP-binding protein [Escherichia coli]|nr:ATP-binding protein [Escherichia coli]EFC8022762.1 ATP-binding protein [Escherichia coli]EFD0789533.1 hypothetical protein [Escherichia coli]EFD0799446.1 hypothetical protein [Escherichia coli]EFD1614419.1 hypothetical protein [Escherichia coli]
MSDGRLSYQFSSDGYIRRSVYAYVISQFPVDKWYGLMENPTTANAILDRLVHNAHRLVL